MSYREPRARVLEIRQDGGVHRIVIELDRQPWRPLAPASLCRDDDPSATLARLHLLVELDGRRASFTTSLPIESELTVGATVVLRSWWSQDQLK